MPSKALCCIGLIHHQSCDNQCLYIFINGFVVFFLIIIPSTPPPPCGESCWLPNHISVSQHPSAQSVGDQAPHFYVMILQLFPQRGSNSSPPAAASSYRLVRAVMLPGPLCCCAVGCSIAVAWPPTLACLSRSNGIPSLLFLSLQLTRCIVGYCWTGMPERGVYNRELRGPSPFLSTQRASALCELDGGGEPF